MKKEYKFTQIKKKIQLALLAIAAPLTFSLAIAGTASAAPLTVPPTTTFAAACKHIGNATDAKNFNGNGENCIFSTYINPFIKFLAGAVGVVVIISIIIGGIQYTTAGGDSGKVAKAKGHITQAVIALLAFLFLLGFLQFIIPGGINGAGS